MVKMALSGGAAGRGRDDKEGVRHGERQGEERRERGGSGGRVTAREAGGYPGRRNAEATRRMLAGPIDIAKYYCITGWVADPVAAD